jgi:hypothetical protein
MARAIRDLRLGIIESDACDLCGLLQHALEVAA